MIEQLISFFPNFSHLEESSLEVGEFEKYWQVTAINKAGHSVGSGFSKTLPAARKIAIAEFIERNFVLNLKNSDKKEQWCLDQYPSSCGFAAGFEPLNTKIRSIGEGLERWALSQWIDKGCYIEPDFTNSWPIESEPLLRDFEKVLVFKKEFIFSFDNKMLPYMLCVVVALTEEGAFLGSGIRSDVKSAKAHALLEAHRHLLISKQARNFEIFPYNRILFFAKNKKVAIEILESKRTCSWASPIIAFQRNFQNNFFCVTRTIFEDWIPWECGEKSRMLY